MKKWVARGAGVLVALSLVGVCVAVAGPLKTVATLSIVIGLVFCLVWISENWNG